MEPVTPQVLKELFSRLGQEIPTPAKFYLLGGSALCILGSSRKTLDVDYSLENATPEIETALKLLSGELQLDLEFVPMSEFIPLPPDAYQRHRFVGRYGQLEVYIFDLYSIALSKIARGFESDLEDGEFLLTNGLITWEALENHFKAILPFAKDVDIGPQEFQRNFEILKQKTQS